MVRAAGLIMIAMQATAAAPSRWIEAAHSADGVIYYLDMSRSTINVDHPVAWFRIDASHAHDSPFNFSLQRVEFDCPGYRMRVASGTTYRELNGPGLTLIPQYTLTDIVPDSVAENLADVVCPAALRRRGAQ